MTPEGLVEALMGKEVPSLGGGGGLGGSPRSVTLWEQPELRSVSSPAAELCRDSGCAEHLCAQPVPEPVTRKVPWWSPGELAELGAWPSATSPGSSSQPRFHLPAELVLWAVLAAHGWSRDGEDGGD